VEPGGDAAASRPCPKRRAAGVSVIVGGLMERMRIGTETRVLAGSDGGLSLMLPDPDAPGAG
jgi:hypothetical protein